MSNVNASNGATPPEFDWQGILTQSVDAWPEPTPLPTGHFTFKVKAGKLDKSKGITTLALQPIEPQSDVDPTAIEAFGDISSGAAFVRFTMSRHDDVSRLQQLIRAIGLGEYGLEDALKAMKDSPVMGEVTHTPKDDGTNGVYVNVRRLGPVG